MGFQVSLHVRISFFDSEEQRLTKGLKAGRPDAQENLYRKLAEKMMAVCMRYARNGDEAADMLQEGFIRVFDKIGTFEESGSLEGWVRKVITNVALRHYQRNAKLYVVADADWTESDSHSSCLDQDHSVEAMLSMIQRLPDGYRMVFNLYAIEGYSHEEIAAMLEISVGTSKSQLSRARQALQRMLLNEENLAIRLAALHA